MQTRHPALTPDQRETLDARGLVRLQGAVPVADAEAMADALWAFMDRKYGIRRHDPGTWTTERPAQFAALNRTGAFARVASPTVSAALDDLLGAWTPPKAWGPPLVAFPGTGRTWVLPHGTWHLDSPAEPGGRGLGTVGRVFVILAPLAPGGGATVVAEGSHRIAEAEADRAGRTLTSAEIRERLRRRDWFRDLSLPGAPAERRRRFMDETTEVEGVPLRVSEMTGQPGDAWLMHPNCLHASAPNVLATPRMVVTQWVLATR